MNIKKLNTLLLAGFLALGLAACEDNATDTPNNDTSNTADESTVDETPTSEKLTLGNTFEFDGSSGLVEITFGTDIEWDVVDNQFADENGETVFRVPVTITNIGDETGSLNMFDFTQFGSQGTSLSSVSFYFDEDVTSAGEMRPGATQESFMYFLYDGDGEYVVEFATFFGDTVEVVFDITK